MTAAINLTSTTSATRRLEGALKWGTSAEHPGLSDVAHATADRMGCVLELIRDTQQAAVAELRDSNVHATAEAEQTQ